MAAKLRAFLRGGGRVSRSTTGAEDLLVVEVLRGSRGSDLDLFWGLFQPISRLRFSSSVIIDTLDCLLGRLSALGELLIALLGLDAAAEAETEANVGVLTAEVGGAEISRRSFLTSLSTSAALAGRLRGFTRPASCRRNMLPVTARRWLSRSLSRPVRGRVDGAVDVSAAESWLVNWRTLVGS